MHGWPITVLELHRVPFYSCELRIIQKTLPNIIYVQTQVHSCSNTSDLLWQYCKCTPWSTSVMHIVLIFNCIYYCCFCSFFGLRFLHPFAFVKMHWPENVKCFYFCDSEHRYYFSARGIVLLSSTLITIIKQWCLIKVETTLGGLCLFLTSHGSFEWLAWGSVLNSIYCIFAKKSSGRRKDASHIRFPLTIIFLLTLHMFTVMFCYPNMFHYYYNSLNVATSLEIIHLRCSHL